MPAKNFVVIDDDALLAQALRIMLEMESFKVQVFHSAEDYLLSISVSPSTPQIYLIDLNLPGLGGCELVKVIRFKDKVSPIFMISGDSKDHSLKRCLAAGADDYMLKPYDPDLLMLKIQNAREKLKIYMGTAMDFGIKMVPEAKLISRDGLKTKLTNNEYAIFDQLMSAPDQIHTRQDLIKRIGNPDLTERTIDVHVSSVRRKLEKLDLGIETLRGKGYRVLIQLKADA